MTSAGRWTIVVVVLAVAGIVALWPRGGEDEGGGPVDLNTISSLPAAGPPEDDAALAPLRQRAAMQPCPSRSPDAPAPRGPLADVRAPCLGTPGMVDLGATLAGRSTLLNFWASWCVPCREEMPALDAIATKYNSDTFMVLPINLDMGESGLKKAQDFLAEGAYQNLPLFADNTFAAFERLKTEAVAIGLPVTLLLDEMGCELAVLPGPAEWNTPDGEAVVEALISL